VNCIFKHIGPSEKVFGWHKYQCQRESCRIVGHSPHPAVIDEYGIERVIGPQCLGGEVTDLALRIGGPGTQLKLLLLSLGITPTASCDCEAMANKMDLWGPDGCRLRAAEIVAHLRQAYDEASVLTTIRAGANAVAQGLPKSLKGLLDLAIERASIPSSDS
jgi:hypothetical protein